MLPVIDGIGSTDGVSTARITTDDSQRDDPRDSQRGRAVLVLPPEAPRTSWLRARANSVGGSEAAAITGLNKWSSPYELWLHKTGRHPGPREDARMRAGHLLEPVTVAMFEAETGLICQPTGMWRSRLCPWEHANPDRFIGEDAGLECKATFDYGAREWEQGPTAHAIIQSQWYMHVTGRTHWYIALLTDGWWLRWWWLDRDDALIARLQHLVAQFWHDNVIADVSPTVDGSPGVREAIRKLYGYTYRAGSRVEIPGLAHMVAQRRQLKEAIAHLQRELDPIENTIKAELADHEIGCEDGKALIAWSSRGENSAVRYLKEL